MVRATQSEAEPEPIGLQVAEAGFNLHAFAVQRHDLVGAETCWWEVGSNEPGVTLLFGKDNTIGVAGEMNDGASGDAMAAELFVEIEVASVGVFGRELGGPKVLGSGRSVRIQIAGLAPRELGLPAIVDAVAHPADPSPA
jgi:hypothetical protein